MNAARRTTQSDYPRDFVLALTRVIEHYLPEERTHYRHCGRTSRRTHTYRDLRTLERILVCWIRAVQ